jgi:hypothetical protein
MSSCQTVKADFHRAALVASRVVVPGCPPRCFLWEDEPVRAENLNPDILVMQPANQGVRHDASDLLNRARDRSILVQ